MKTNLLLLLILLLNFHIIKASNIDFTAYVGGEDYGRYQDTIAKVEAGKIFTIVYDLHVDHAFNKTTNFIRPSFDNIFIIVDSSYGSNGKTPPHTYDNSFAECYSYKVKIMQKGEFIIPSATISINGGKYTSNSIRIKVIKGNFSNLNLKTNTQSYKAIIIPNSISTSITAKHQRIPGTGLFTEIPSAYIFNKLTQRYEKQDYISYFNCMQTNTISNKYPSLNENSLRQNALLLYQNEFYISLKSYNLDSISGLKKINFNNHNAWYGEFIDEKTKEFDLLFMTGDSTFEMIFMAKCDSADEISINEFRNIIRTAYFDQELNIDPMEKLNFNIALSKNHFFYAGEEPDQYGGKDYYFSKNGQIDSLNLTGTTFFTISSIFETDPKLLQQRLIMKGYALLLSNPGFELMKTYKMSAIKESETEKDTLIGNFQTNLREASYELNKKLAYVCTATLIDKNTSPMDEYVGIYFFTAYGFDRDINKMKEEFANIIKSINTE